MFVTTNIVICPIFKSSARKNSGVLKFCKSGNINIFIKHLRIYVGATLPFVSTLLCLCFGIDMLLFFTVSMLTGKSSERVELIGSYAFVINIIATLFWH